MLSDYIQHALERAQYEILEGGLYCGEIPELQGVLAVAETLELCRTELKAVLESWIVVKLSSNDPIPAIDGIDLTAEHKKIA